MPKLPEAAATMSTSKFLDYARDKLMIDRSDLDTAWVEQPQVYNEIAERLAMEISRRDEAKNELKDLEARIDGELREDAEADLEKNGVKKPTETAFKNMVREDKRWKKANIAQLELDKNVALLQARKEAYMQRRYALENLVTLHVSGYGMSASSRPARDQRHADNRKGLHRERVRRQEEEE
jgi:hypothetical protein